MVDWFLFYINPYTKNENDLYNIFKNGTKHWNKILSENILQANRQGLHVIIDEIIGILG